MSFILDALRKSESRRRSGQAPQLGDHHGDHPAVGRRRRPAILVMVLAIAAPMVVAALAVVYFQPGFLDRGDSTPATAESSGGDTQPPRPEQLALAEADEDETGSGIEQSAPDDATETRQRRRRVRTPPPEDDETVDARSEPRERIVTDPDEAMEEIQREVEQSERRLAQPDDETTEEPRTRTPPPAEPEVGEEAEPETGDEAWRPEAAEYVRAWELPLAVRREMPDLDLSIHVFAPEADKRFVLINGERRVAGDELGGGARLVEIRREGALVDFRDHRFLLEP